MNRIILYILSISVILLISCSNDDLNYPGFTWHLAVGLPDGLYNADLLEGEPGELYITGSAYSAESYWESVVICRYANGELEELFRKDLLENYWGIYKSGYANGVYWAGGSRRENEVTYSFIFRIYEGTCEEFPGPDTPYFQPTLVLPISADEVYFFDEQFCYHYINGAWETRQLPFGPSWLVYDNTTGLIYSYEELPNERYACRISSDYFRNYVEEEANLLGGGQLTNAGIHFERYSFYEGKLYITAQLFTDSRVWFALIERSGEPGSGQYRVIYRRDKELNGWDAMVALSGNELLSALEDSHLILRYKNGDAEVFDNYPYDPFEIVFSDGLVWAIAWELNEEGEAFGLCDLIYHIPGE